MADCTASASCPFAALGARVSSLESRLVALERAAAVRAAEEQHDHDRERMDPCAYDPDTALDTVDFLVERKKELAEKKSGGTCPAPPGPE